MQKFIAVGRLTNDPETRTSQSGMEIARFTLAIDRFSKGEEKKADFIRCIAFDKKAEFSSKYLKKGTKVIIAARVQVENYTDKDGNKRTSTDFVIDEIEFAESKKNAENQQSEVSNQSEVPDDGFVNVESDIDDSLPFN